MHKKSFTYRYGDENIEYDIWFTDADGVLSTIIFLGTIQIGKLPEWVAKACPPGTAVVEGAPHWRGKNDGSDVRDFVYEFSENALRNLVHTHELVNVKIFADSQAAPFALKAALVSKYFRNIHSIVLIQPLGLNIHAYGSDDMWRLKMFKRRLMVNALSQLAYLPIDSRLVYNHYQLFGLISSDQQKADAQYAAGLAHDALDDLEKAIARGYEVTVVCGSRDKLFSPKEIRQAISERKLPVSIKEVTGVPHSPLPTKQGLKLLREALK